MRWESRVASAAAASTGRSARPELVRSAPSIVTRLFSKREPGPMPRRREVQKRRILPDPKYGDRLVAKFINDLMREGKKSTAEQICYGAFHIAEERSKEDPLKL